ncbi:MAG: hypothetical protein BWK80_13800 [Desulfobacteraceae bacterium IS3]|nr:MAG: hypothetical protein BWK80_13800 [Desulfobacteraceae bacterium IS3]
MELESYFEFINEYAIRIRGTRVNIETVLQNYQDGASPEEIAIRYPTLSFEQIHAAILYYLAKQKHVEDYLTRVRNLREQGWREQQQYPTNFVRELCRRLEQQRMKLHRNRQEEIVTAE